MPVPSRIFNGEDYRQLHRDLPLASSFENRCRANAHQLATLKAEREFVTKIGYPKLVRDALRFQTFNFIANMTQMGAYTGIWIHRLVSLN